MFLSVKAYSHKDGCTGNSVKLQPSSVLFCLPKCKSLCHSETTNIRSLESEINRVSVRRLCSAALWVYSDTGMSPWQLFPTATGRCVNTHLSVAATWLFMIGRTTVSKVVFQTLTCREKKTKICYIFSNQSKKFYISLPLKFQTVLKIQRSNTKTNYLKE